MFSKKLEIIGANVAISFLGYHNVPAKVDTGADSSALWVSEIEMQSNGILRFKFFAPSSPFYHNEIYETTEYSVSRVRSSNGIEQIRYRTKIPTQIGNRTIKINYTLADRSNNNFPVLIGRRTLKNKFLVDVSKKYFDHPHKHKSIELNLELKKDPYNFHKKYIKPKKG